jgi:hypothetical protein
MPNRVPASRGSPASRQSSPGEDGHSRRCRQTWVYEISGYPGACEMHGSSVYSSKADLIPGSNRLTDEIHAGHGQIVLQLHGLPQSPPPNYGGGLPSRHIDPNPRGGEFVPAMLKLPSHSLPVRFGQIGQPVDQRSLRDK